jgi:translation initiation factor 1 (eIF-1/SUI1)
MKPGSRRRKKLSYKGTAKGALEFAANPQRVALKELRKELRKKVSTGGKIEMPLAKPN